jgi:hypothetical protein
LPSGTVVFEDVNPETLKGQVLKPLERGANVAALNTEPLSGRLRYRGRDRSEVEIPFGDKDQKGEYTLRYIDRFSWPPYVFFLLLHFQDGSIMKLNSLFIMPQAWRLGPVQCSG